MPNNGKKPGQTRWESVLADSAAADYAERQTRKWLGSVLPLRMNVLRTEDAVTSLKDLRCPPE